MEDNNYDNHKQSLDWASTRGTSGKDPHSETPFVAFSARLPTTFMFGFWARET